MLHFSETEMEDKLKLCRDRKASWRSSDLSWKDWKHYELSMCDVPRENLFPPVSKLTLITTIIYGKSL